MLHTNRSEDKTKSRKRKTHRIGICSILRSCICLPRITIELANESVIGESVRETAVIGAQWTLNSGVSSLESSGTRGYIIILEKGVPKSSYSVSQPPILILFCLCNG